MKKITILFLICVTLFSGIVHAQKRKATPKAKTQAIVGIGELKIGCPSSIISQLGFEMSPKEINKYGSYLSISNQKSGNTAYELKADLSKEENFDGNASLNPKVKAYYLPEYKVSDELTIHGVFLKFYNNSLYSIICDGSASLTNFLDKKYGNSKSKTEYKKHNTINSDTGVERERIDATTSCQWKTNNSNISCSQMSSIFFNYDDKKRAVDIVVIINEKTANVADK